MGVRAVSFDADGTLWDFQAVMTVALNVVLAELKARFPSTSVQTLTLERLIEIRNEVAAEMSEPDKRPTTSFLTDVRRAAFERTVETLGLGDAGLSEELTRLYFERRWAPTEVYPDVLPALEELHGQYVMGVLTNGNGKLEAAGIADTFSFVIYADDHGVEKPDPLLFEEVLRVSACEPQELVHVGDSLPADVVGAQAVGIRAVWLNRTGDANNSGTRPDAEIRSLLELPAVLGSFNLNTR